MAWQESSRCELVRVGCSSSTQRVETRGSPGLKVRGLGFSVLELLAAQGAQCSEQVSDCLGGGCAWLRLLC